MTIENFFRGVAALVGGLMFLSLPTQAAIELLGWIKEAEWKNYDLIWYLGPDQAKLYYSSEMKGFNYVVESLMDIWISVPIGLVGLVLFNFAVAD